MKLKRLHIRRVIDDKKEQIKSLQLEVDRLERSLGRMYCGCLYLDCTEHGSYDPEDIALVEYYLKFRQ
jgi:hypothetical protein